jgi:carboxyl-terminal processing protease
MIYKPSNTHIQNRFPGQLIRPSIVLLGLASLAACGGGGSGGKIAGPGSNDDYQPGVFLDYDTFFARCDAPRSGTNPATGSAYPDIQGSTTDENNFLRSYSNDTYLWYDEITDSDPAGYDDPLNYFALLRTTATTPSEQPKDKFHFTYDTDDYNQLSQSGVSAGYGVKWVLLSRTPPREILVAYTEPDSPATNLALPLERGAEVLEIDGVDINDNTDAGIDTINAGLFPSDVGEVHTFTVRDLDTTGTRTLSMTTESVTSAPVQNTKVLTTLSGAVGYMIFNDHIATAEQALIDAVNQLNSHNDDQGIDDLVIDIRYNGGGFLDIASELAYMVAGPVPTAGRTFEELQFNDKHPATNPITGQALSPTLFHTRARGAPFNGTAGQALPVLNLPRVFVLTGPGTCSASEAVMNGLRGVGVEVIQIGSTTCGKPYGFYPTDNCGTTYFTIQFRGVNEMDFGDYTDGFSPDNTPADQAGSLVPGCSVADDFTKQLGDPTENRLSVALAYRDGQACPATSAGAPAALSKPAVSFDAIDGVVPKSPFHTNRIVLP